MNRAGIGVAGGGRPRGFLPAVKWLLALGVIALAASLWLSASRASASTLTDCLSRQNVCVVGDGRGLVSAGQQAQLERQIGNSDIYLVVAASGSAGYNSAMNQVVSGLGGHPHRFAVQQADGDRLLVSAGDETPSRWVQTSVGEESEPYAVAWTPDSGRNP